MPPREELCHEPTDRIADHDYLAQLEGPHDRREVIGAFRRVEAAGTDSITVSA